MTEEQRCQYQTIIQARNFHYEQFTRWSGYFYVIIGVLFIGYCLIVQTPAANTADCRVLGWVVLCIGYIASVANYLAVNGYVYWWNRWTRLLTNFEKKACTEEEESVYNALAEKPKSDISCRLLKGRDISPEKVTIALAGMVILGWSILIGFKASSWIISLLGIDDCCHPYVPWVTAIVLWAIGLLLSLLSYCKSMHIGKTKHTDSNVEKSK